MSLRQHIVLLNTHIFENFIIRKNNLFLAQLDDYIVIIISNFIKIL